MVDHDGMRNSLSDGRPEGLRRTGPVGTGGRPWPWVRVAGVGLGLGRVEASEFTRGWALELELVDAAEAGPLAELGAGGEYGGTGSWW